MSVPHKVFGRVAVKLSELQLYLDGLEQRKARE